MKTTAILNYTMFFILILSLLVFQKTIAQSVLRDEFNEVYLAPNTYIEVNGAIDGSPYLNTDYTPARINNKEKTNMVRFNAHNGKVEVLLEANKVIELSQKKLLIYNCWMEPIENSSPHST